jgi:superfamily I DNA/RNA helicase
MAVIHPSVASIRPSTTGEYAEYELIRLLKDYQHQRKDILKQFVQQRIAMRIRLNDAHLHDIDFQKRTLEGIPRQLADGLATWVPRITSPSGLYCISATAGCSITQMSLAALNQAAADGKKALYVCFNRPLADRIRPMLSSRVTAANYDELCMDWYRRGVEEPDFSDVGVFQRVRVAFMQQDSTTAVLFDLVIIDEAQDFEPAWIEHLLRIALSDAGKAYVLNDEEQRIYKREAFDLPDAVQICCDDNFRSPQNIVAFINLLKLTQRPIRARSPLSQGIVESMLYADEKSLLTNTGRGTKNSALLKTQVAGSHHLRCFTGQYDAKSEPVWTQGSMVADTVYRSKGQSAQVFSV